MYLLESALLMTDQARLRLSNILKESMGDRAQRNFAKELGISHVTLRSWIECEAFPNQASIEKIAEMRNQGLEEFLQELRGEPLNPKKAEDLIALAKNLSEEEILRLTNMLLEQVSTDYVSSGDLSEMPNLDNLEKFALLLQQHPEKITDLSKHGLSNTQTSSKEQIKAIALKKLGALLITIGVLVVGSVIVDEIIDVKEAQEQELIQTVKSAKSKK